MNWPGVAMGRRKIESGGKMKNPQSFNQVDLQFLTGKNMAFSPRSKRIRSTPETVPDREIAGVCDQSRARIEKFSGKKLPTPREFQARLNPKSLLEKLAATGNDPGQIIAEAMRGDRLDADQKLQLAMALLEYCYPKLRSQSIDAEVSVESYEDRLARIRQAIADE